MFSALYSSAYKHNLACFFFWWLNYMVNESFVTLYDKDTKPINFILLPANSTSKALLSQDCSGNSFLF